ncbi:alpha/beta hydrolase family protein [Streptomonospora litoralis]|nr:alpha/beta hydrolase [Streptomonospora litoralis]
MSARKHGFSPARRRAAAYPAAAAVVAVCCAVPAAVAAVADPDPIRLHPPEPTGPYSVGRADLHLVDESRGHPWVEGAEKRDVPVSVWYPAEDTSGERAPYMPDAVAEVMAGQVEQLGLPRDAVDFAGSDTDAFARADAAPGAGKLPVVLYSHGFRQSRHQATAQLEELASSGYAAVAMDHPYETSAVELPGGRIVRDAAPGSGAEALRTAVGVRVADTRFVLDALEDIAEGRNPDAAGRALPRGLSGALDLSAVGMYGHSLGGLTVAEAVLADDRIDAGADLDGTIAYHVGEEEWAESTVEGVDRPFLLMGGGVIGGSADPHTSGHAPDWRMFRRASTGPFTELYLPDAEHMSFTDSQWILPQVGRRLELNGRKWEDAVTGSVGTVDPQRSVAAQRAYITAFFDRHLRGEGAPLLDGPSAEYPAVEFVG